MSALFKLSKITGISQKILSTAGLKDKRGITTQMVSVYNTEVYQLNRFFEQADRNREIWIDGIVEFKNDAIAVGCLQGNQFGLVLRLLKGEDAQ
jgi:tRNA(Glu) U13 pseudouridine synthase TruD